MCTCRTFLLCACLRVYAGGGGGGVMVEGGYGEKGRRITRMLWGIRQTKFPHERATLIKATGGGPLSDCILHPFAKLELTSGAVSSLSLSLSLSFLPHPPFLFALLSSRPLLSRLPLFSYNLLQPLLIFPQALTRT